MSKKILILDDSDDILEVMKDVLEMEGYEIQAMTFNADLVILDYILFGINGGELCHMLKTNPLTAHIPVVMVSAYPRVLESLGNYGSDAFIAKPFGLTDIVNTVRGCLLKTGDIEHADW
jgi:CheY-like chemotaxis protein